MSRESQEELDREEREAAAERQKGPQSGDDPEFARRLEAGFGLLDEGDEEESVDLFDEE